MQKRKWGSLLWLLAMAASLGLGVWLLHDRQYAAVSAWMMLLACVPFLFRWEKQPASAATISLLAVLTALSVVGRFVFAPLPFFKPVAAIVIIAGLSLGGEYGFVCGAASALLSNFYFGQGPWTPFQMFAWGCIGWLAGCLAGPLKKNRAVLCGFGALAGILFSLLMDVWTGLWMDGEFLWSRYIANVLTALPVTAIYMVSNAVFLWALARPLGRKIEHTLRKW